MYGTHSLVLDGCSPLSFCHPSARLALRMQDSRCPELCHFHLQATHAHTPNIATTVSCSSLQSRHLKSSPRSSLDGDHRPAMDGYSPWNSVRRNALPYLSMRGILVPSWIDWLPSIATRDRNSRTTTRVSSQFLQQCPVESGRRSWSGGTPWPVLDELHSSVWSPSFPRRLYQTRYI